MRGPHPPHHQKSVFFCCWFFQTPVVLFLSSKSNAAQTLLKRVPWVPVEKPFQAHLADFPGPLCWQVAAVSPFFLSLKVFRNKPRKHCNFLVKTFRFQITIKETSKIYIYICNFIHDVKISKKQPLRRKHHGGVPF